MAELASGSMVAGCRIQAVVGRGGMGVVYRATQLSLDRPVALKVIAPELAGDATFRERFKRESRLAASIEHPNVIPVYEAGEGDGVLYLIMRYVEGTDLRALIDAEGALEPARATRIVAQVAAALAAAHRRGLIHRDVKPANVLIDSGAERDHAYLTDFGIARETAATSGLTRTGAVIGTLDYLAPERIEDGGGDGRADVYALGCVLFEALTGTIPYARDSDVAKMFAHLNAPVPSVSELRPTVPRELDELARRAMAKDPDERLPSASEFAEALTSTAPARFSSAVERTRPIVIPAPPGEDTPAPEPAETAGAPRAETADAEPAEPVAAVPPETVRAAPAETRRAERSDEARGRALPPRAIPSGAAAPPRAPGRRRAGLLAAVGAGVAGVAAVLVLSLSGGDEGAGEPERAGERPATGTREREEPAAPLDPRVLRGQVLDIGAGADGAAAGDGFVWVANRDTGEVVRIDAESREVKRIPVGAEPDSIAIEPGGPVWVTNTSGNSVSRIDPEAGEPAGEPIQVGQAPEGIAIGLGAVWVANGASGSVTRIDLDSSEVEETVLGDTTPVQIAIGDDEVWITRSDDDVVMALDPDTGNSIGRDVAVTGTPRGIAFDGERIWVSATNAGRVVHFDPANPDDRGEVRVPPGPREVRFGEGAVWVASSGSGRVTAIDPESFERLGSVAVEPVNYALAVADGLVWTASEDTGRLFPIDPRPGG